MATRWLSQCLRNKDGKHTECNVAQAGYHPTRLLDVEGAVRTGHLRLVAFQEEDAKFGPDDRYITLSHCWGEWGRTSLPSLTSTNEAERLRAGTALQTLPPRFRDAVEISRWFGVRWLWIDCLCILQDSLEDWQREALRMPDVYKNSLLNISADAAWDAQGGCFRDRRPLEVSPMLLRFPEMDDQDFWLTVDDKHHFTSVKHAPVAQRAWCFQERPLARRVLHFTDRELIWECCAAGQSFASETFLHGAPFAKVFSGMPKMQNLGSLDKETVYTQWNEMCKLYSQRGLTYVSDKLVALSGLAKEVQHHIPNDAYLAGLWMSTLPIGLLWQARTKSKRLPSTPFVAPSWSWASIDGPIQNIPGDDEDDESSNFLRVAQVLDATIDPVVAADPTSSLRTASLTVSGLLRPIELRPDYKEYPWYMFAVAGGQIHELTVIDCGREFSTGGGGPIYPHFLFSLDTEPNHREEDPMIRGFYMPVDVK